ncbi:hypothetical protein EJB05_08915 [Eragrostis curvula]|uniref:Uncharacterized protein n=1 Tax=Eragrostis curvula TaxID=38414 RepID=A0A5J9W4S3_9POAL|nr:hypothetical protein EJB05_08915 [Eragrostis curvula]
MVYAESSMVKSRSGYLATTVTTRTPEATSHWKYFSLHRLHEGKNQSCVIVDYENSDYRLKTLRLQQE